MHDVHVEALREFDLVSDDLIRVSIFHLRDSSVILINVHHAVGDAWSSGIILQELAVNYSAALRNVPLESMPHLHIQYADFVVWQMANLDQSRESLIEWWKKTLAGIPAIIQLPTRQTRPQDPKYSSKTVHGEMGDTLQRVIKLAADHRLNTQALLLASLQAVLYRYSGQEDIAIGVPAAGREMPEVQPLIGYFINTVVVRGAVTDSVAFIDLASEAYLSMLDAVDHSQLPFAEVVSASGAKVTSNVNPIFQVLFQYVPDGSSIKPTLEGMKAQVCPAPKLKQAKTDLSVFITGDGHISIDYMDEIHDESTMTNIMDSFLLFLDNACMHPESPVSCLPISAPSALIAHHMFGSLKTDYVQGPLTTQLFEMWAQRSPTQPCLVLEGEILSYEEVNARANRLARKLVHLGVGRNVAVGLMMDRSFELVISMLAAMKAGGFYVPLDPDYPDDRLSIYMEDSSAAVLVAGREHLMRANKLGGADAQWTVIIAEEFDWDAGDPSNLPEDRIARDSLAYVIFTSGSTGRPKGVMIDHIALLDFVRYNLEYYSVTEKDTCLLSITINFDPHVMQVFTGLAAGARLVIAKPGGHVDAEYMSDLLADWEVSFYNTVPALGLEYYKTEGAKRCTSLKSAIFSGEAMPIELVDLIYRNVPPGVKVVNAYGPTEATVMATNLTCERGMTSMTIGFPEHNMHCYIVDASMNMVPPGVPGELILSGPRLAQGYIGRPDLTAENRFLTSFVWICVK